MDNVAIVVDDLDSAVAFFTELGMELEGKAQIQGVWADRTVGLDGVRSDIAMMRTPDGHGRLELTKYYTPAAADAGPENPPPNTLGLHRVMFAVDDIDDTVVRLRAPRRRTPRRGGAVRGHLPALLRPWPRRHHRRPSRTDRLTRARYGARMNPHTPRRRPEPQPCVASGWLSRKWLPLGSRTAASRTP
jgi:catechol 2,3-dioxygenase-like lactoylglutathione lyase family enzyme